jgi:hypothetical protein
MARYPSYGPLDSPMADAGDVSFVRLNARLRPDQLQPGEVAVSENGRMDLNGSWQPRRPHEAFGGTIATDAQALTVPFFTYANVTASGISVSGDTITLTFAAPHPFNDQTLVGVAGITGLSPDPNGNRLITVVDATTIEFDVIGITGTEGGTVIVGAPFLQDDLVAGVYGSCLFSDPSSNNEEYIIIATNAVAKAIKLSDGSSSDIAYPAGIRITRDVNMIQAFNYVFIFRDGLTALEWDGDFTGSPAFALVANGNYAVNAYLNASNNTDIADGIVTVSETGHGLSVGQKIVVIDKDGTNLVEDQEYTVATVPNANSFTFFAAVEDDSNKNVVYSRRLPVQVGFTHMPAPPWAVYHQRRLWMPFKYLSTGTSGNPTIVNREIADEIIASDIFDQDTYDQLANQFRIASGGADYVVALQPFAEDNLVVFNRNTIHIVAGTTNIDQSQVRELTREVGCVARKSVVQVGNQIFFLSDNGVYSVDFGDLYNLRGASVPLSESIDPIIKRINTDAAENAVAIYHNNRYYLAVPLDGSTENNAVLVYNFINQGWESVDTVAAPGWNIRNLIRAGAGAFNKLYAINSLGGIHILENRVDDTDFIVTQIGQQADLYYVPSKLLTRQYTLSTLDRKKFNNMELTVQSSDSNASDLTIDVVCENPDSDTQVTTLSNLLGGPLTPSEDASVRTRVGNKRGYGAQIRLTPTQGRPKIRAVKTTAQLTDLALSSKQ